MLLEASEEWGESGRRLDKVAALVTFDAIKGLVKELQKRLYAYLVPPITAAM